MVIRPLASCRPAEPTPISGRTEHDLKNSAPALLVATAGACPRIWRLKDGGYFVLVRVTDPCAAERFQSSPQSQRDHLGRRDFDPFPGHGLCHRHKCNLIVTRDSSKAVGAAAVLVTAADEGVAQGGSPSLG